MSIEISLNDKKFFETFIGERVLKEQVFNSNGEIPLYSSNVAKPFGFVEMSNIKDFDYNYILWGIDGNFDFNVKHKGELFATTDHCGAIRILDDKIIPEFLLFQLEIKKYELGFDRTLRASLRNMRLINITLPTNGNNGIDVVAQKSLIKKYGLLKNLKEDLTNRINELESAIFEFEQDGEYKTEPISELFKFVSGNPKYTQKYVVERSGNYPVYSSNTKQGGLLGKINTYDFENECIQITTNGVYAGTLFYRPKHKFSINADARLLVKKHDNLNYFYLLFQLRKTLKPLGFNWQNKASISRIKDVGLQIPIKKKGEYDLEKQNDIAKKQVSIYQIKEGIVQNLQNLNDSVVVF